MKDYTALKKRIHCPASKAGELDDFLQDTELVSLVERMCKNTKVELDLYIEFLLTQLDKAPGKPSFHQLVQMVVEQGRRERPEFFE